MFVAAMVLGIATTVVELSLFCRIKAVKNIVERNALFGVAYSVALALFLGAVFGAHGVTVMLAAMGSMVVTMPIYWVYNMVVMNKKKGGG